VGKREDNGKIVAGLDGANPDGCKAPAPSSDRLHRPGAAVPSGSSPPARPSTPAGGITAWIDYGSRTEKATFYGTTVGDRQVWPAADLIGAWLHETALRLFPDSPYAKTHKD
jgi:hypothetical protein